MADTASKEFWPVDKRPHEFVRVLRYVGSREAIERNLEQRGVKGSSRWDRDCKIYEVSLQDFPTPMPTAWFRDLLKSKLQDSNEYKTDFREGYEAAIRELLEELPL